MEIGPRREGLKLFLQRLEARSALSAAERQAVLGLRGYPQKVAAHRDFGRAGDDLQESCLIVDGLAARYALVEDGSRQIISLHLPGDMVDLYSLMLPRASSPLHALTDTTIMKVRHDDLRALVLEHINVSAALWRDCVVDSAIVGQWLVNIGRKNSRGRIAHLLAEMAVRYAQIGMLKDGVYFFPMTQEQIGDAMGLTSVHVNRSIRSLREDGLVQISRPGVQILDWRGLTKVADFDPDYLLLPNALVDLEGPTLRQLR